MYSTHHCSWSISSSSTTASSSSSVSSSTPPSSPASQRTSIPSTSSKLKATLATRQRPHTSACTSINIAINNKDSIFAFNPDDYTPSKVKKASELVPATKEHIDPMRVFYPSSSASPFCACSTHALPDDTPAMGDTWGHEPVDSPRNSLKALSSSNVDHDGIPPFFLPYPAWYCDPGLRIAPSPLNQTTLEKGRILYSTDVALSASEDGEEVWHDAVSVSEASTLPTSATELSSLERADPPISASAQKKAEYLTTSMSMFGAPAEVQEAHWLYHQSFADKAQTPRAVLADLVERNLRRTAMLGLLKMKTALKQMTIMSFKDMFRVRSDIWKFIEQTAHPQQCSCGYYLTSLDLEGDGLADDFSYGHPARRLGAFAGALFALDVLSFNDFRTCLDILRAKSGCVAAQALHAAVLHAGDRVCKTKNREYMIELAEEQKRRLDAPWVGHDRGVKDLLNQIITRIDEYLDSQVSKQVHATVKVLPRRRGQKIAMGTSQWGMM